MNPNNVLSDASKSSFFKSQQAIPSIMDANAEASTTQQSQNPIKMPRFKPSIELVNPAGREDVFDTVEDLEEGEEAEKLGKLGKPEVSEEKSEKSENEEGETGEIGGSEKPEKLEKSENEEVETEETQVTEEPKGSEKSEKPEKPEKPENSESNEKNENEDGETEETEETAVPQASNETLVLTEIPANSTTLLSNSMESVSSSSLSLLFESVNHTTVSPRAHASNPPKGRSSKRKSSKHGRKGRNARRAKLPSSISNSTEMRETVETVDPKEPVNLSEVSSLGFNFSKFYRDFSTLPIHIETPVSEWVTGSSIFQNYVNDVFLPRQMETVARASNPIIYVARNDAKLEQQMIGICDVFLLSLLYNRPFKCCRFPRGNDL